MKIQGVYMNENFKKIVLNATGASDLYEIEMIQSLWSGYGKIVRYGLTGCSRESVVVKLVQLPEHTKHPRGWNTDMSHMRKIKSYEVETAWYQEWSDRCDDFCRIPHCLALESEGDEVLIVMEDLDSCGFPERVTSVSQVEMRACLRWLANFHATFLHEKPEHLWEVGTYWHLDTRPDELRVLTDTRLKNAAAAIDKKLCDSPYQTFVHGDAKLANFCFAPDGTSAAAVDFQYVGGGCGMKDVAYFIGSCLYEEDCERYESELLEYYFYELKTAVIRLEKDVDFSELETNWREMYKLAWTDFHRFLKGWSPGHWKINGYSERIASEVIESLS